MQCIATSFLSRNKLMTPNVNKTYGVSYVKVPQTRISLSKKRRLVAELEALAERGDVAKDLEYMRDIVARDTVTLEELETLLARAQVGVSLKVGYIADMEEKE
ncbi:hypothetical protein Tco_0759459 [Tanacetum coccineum]